jgi:hypothetical protein
LEFLPSSNPEIVNFNVLHQNAYAPITITSNCVEQKTNTCFGILAVQWLPIFDREFNGEILIAP